MAVFRRGGRLACLSAQPDTYTVHRRRRTRLHMQSAGAALTCLESAPYHCGGDGDGRVVAAVRIVAVDCVAAAGKGNQPVRDAFAGLDRGGACSIDAEVAAVVWRRLAMG